VQLLPFGRLWYGEPDAISNAKFRSQSQRDVIRVYDEEGKRIETHKRAGGVQRAVAWRYIHVRVVLGKIGRYFDGCKVIRRFHWTTGHLFVKI
jgi:hypothetical protein